MVTSSQTSGSVVEELVFLEQRNSELEERVHFLENAREEILNETQKDFWMSRQNTVETICRNVLKFW